MSTPVAAPPKQRSRLTIVVIVIVFLIVAVAAAYLLLQSAKPSSNPTVVIASGTGSNQSLNFKPVTITVMIGKNNTITFVNDDVTQHTVSFFSGPAGVSLSTISDPSLAKGSSFTVTLTTAGTYYYKCFIHTWMYGKVIVESS